jgi:cytochrome c-type biogenesis protein CcsB
MIIESLLLEGAAGLYLIATVAALVGVAAPQVFPRRLLAWLLLGATVVHTAAVVLHATVGSEPPLSTFPEALSLLALLLVSLFLAVQVRIPLLALAAVVSPLAFALTLAARVMNEGAPTTALTFSVWLPVHVGLALLGDAVFALAFSASLLYLVQERRLKAYRGRGLLRHLPSLETLDRVNHACLAWGLILLTLGIVSGIVWAHEAWTRLWVWDPKVLLTLLVWTFYVVLLQGRMTAGWRGRVAAQLTIAGFAVILVSFVGVNVLALGSHGAF